MKADNQKYRIKTEMNILALPDTVVFQIFDRLSNNELLLLRGTCHKISQIVDKYQFKLCRRLSEYTVRFNGKGDMKRFVSKVTYTPFSNFHFNFPLQYVDITSLDAFLSKYGILVKSLYIMRINALMSTNERHFFEMMPNLKTLKIDVMKLRENRWNTCASLEYANHFSSCTNDNLHTAILPKPFESIEALKILVAPDPLALRIFLFGCPNLKAMFYIMPKEIHLQDVINYEIGTSYASLHSLTLYLQKIPRSLQEGSTFALGIKDLDINNIAAERFILFIRTISEKQIRLFEMCSHFLCRLRNQISTLSKDEEQNFLDSVVHVKGTCACIAFKRLPSLQEITFHYSSFSFGSFAPGFERQDKDNWPMVKKIKFCMKFYYDDFCRQQAEFEGLWDYLFNIRREHLKSIQVEVTIIDYAPPYFEIGPTLDLSLMVNLETLILDVSILTEGDYVALFRGLAEDTNIKRIDIKFSCKITNKIFFGAEEANPTFLRMKSLRHCVFRGGQANQTKKSRIDSSACNMHGVREFVVDVLPQSSLTCLIIATKDEKIFQMTESGVRSILNGNLANTLRYIQWDSSVCGEIHPTLIGVYLTLKKIAMKNRRRVITCGSEQCENCQNS